jgi:hypothetical protein
MASAKAYNIRSAYLMKFESREDRMKAQTVLKHNGFYFGKIDGIWGNGSKKAYASYLATRPAPTLILEPPAAKPWWTSRALLGSLGTLITFALALVGISVESAALTEVLVLVSGAILSIISLWGTIDRKAPIDSDKITNHFKWSDL